MNAIRIFAIAAALALSASPAAAGKVALHLAAGQSINELGHGTALEAHALGQVAPWLAIGIETGVCYLRTSQSVMYYPQPAGEVVSGLTDGITRHRGYFLGPEIRVGQDLYAVASAGIYDLNGDDRAASRILGGTSVGIGLSGGGRIQPVAEIRYRHVGHRSEPVLYGPAYGPAPNTFPPDPAGSSTTFTFGVIFR